MTALAPPAARPPARSERLRLPSIDGAEASQLAGCPLGGADEDDGGLVDSDSDRSPTRLSPSSRRNRRQLMPRRPAQPPRHASQTLAAEQRRRRLEQLKTGRRQRRMEPEEDMRGEWADRECRLKWERLRRERKLQKMPPLAPAAAPVASSTDSPWRKEPLDVPMVVSVLPDASFACAVESPTAATTETAATACTARVEVSAKPYVEAEARSQVESEVEANHVALESWCVDAAASVVFDLEEDDADAPLPEPAAAPLQAALSPQRPSSPVKQLVPVAPPASLQRHGPRPHPRRLQPREPLAPAQPLPEQQLTHVKLERDPEAQRSVLACAVPSAAPEAEAEAAVEAEDDVEAEAEASLVLCDDEGDMFNESDDDLIREALVDCLMDRLSSGAVASAVDAAAPVEEECEEQGFSVVASAEADPAASACSVALQGTPDTEVVTAFTSAATPLAADVATDTATAVAATVDEGALAAPGEDAIMPAETPEADPAASACSVALQGTPDTEVVTAFTSAATPLAADVATDTATAVAATVDEGALAAPGEDAIMPAETPEVGAAIADTLSALQGDADAETEAAAPSAVALTPMDGSIASDTRAVSVEKTDDELEENAEDQEMPADVPSSEIDPATTASVAQVDSTGVDAFDALQGASEPEIVVAHPSIVAPVVAASDVAADAETSLMATVEEVVMVADEVPVEAANVDADPAATANVVQATGSSDAALVDGTAAEAAGIGGASDVAMLWPLQVDEDDDGAVFVAGLDLSLDFLDDAGADDGASVEQLSASHPDAFASAPVAVPEAAAASSAGRDEATEDSEAAEALRLKPEIEERLQLRPLLSAASLADTDALAFDTANDKLATVGEDAPRRSVGDLIALKSDDMRLQSWTRIGERLPIEELRALERTRAQATDSVLLDPSWIRETWRRRRRPSVERPRVTGGLFSGASSPSSRVSTSVAQEDVGSVDGDLTDILSFEAFHQRLAAYRAEVHSDTAAVADVLGGQLASRDASGAGVLSDDCALTFGHERRPPPIRDDADVVARFGDADERGAFCHRACSEQAYSTPLPPPPDFDPPVCPLGASGSGGNDGASRLFPSWRQQPLQFPYVPSG
eukprot:TRINITY_DN2251_c0_g1_i1.p1 TRINITY_DN2251_c0_g1~~TRINITY_DN2251_c0_g1_i1.p1  ORF type:complete len:1118 (+),score=297.41 TRINITY_DN2251_c0_g1_i1:44-3355(+)